MSALISLWTPSDFAFIWEEEGLLRSQFCVLRTLCGKNKDVPFLMVPMAVDTWLDFYNLFQEYLCVDSVLAMGGNTVFQNIEKKPKEKESVILSWPYIYLVHQVSINSYLPSFPQSPSTKTKPSTATTVAPTFLKGLYWHTIQFTQSI